MSLIAHVATARSLETVCLLACESGRGKRKRVSLFRS
jgi:hypothetical protein